MDLVDVTVYYLEMRSPPERRFLEPWPGAAVAQVPAPSVPEYRALYNAVGAAYRWLSRRKMSDETLSALLRDPGIELHVLSIAGQTAGFAELDRRQPGAVELVQFGLLPEFIGQGLGKWFLQWTLRLCWSYGPQRVWLHTCTFDHPAALPNYLKAGFVQYKQEQLRREY